MYNDNLQLLVYSINYHIITKVFTNKTIFITEQKYYYLLMCVFFYFDNAMWQIDDQVQALSFF